MWSAIILIISVHISCTQARSATLLANCNWVLDEGWPAAGYFAIGSTPYCNLVNNYDWENASIPLLSTYSFTYQCNSDGFVDKNLYNTADCTGTALVSDVINDTSRLNCGGASSCIMHTIRYADIDHKDSETCTPDTNKVVEDAFRVNGICSKWYFDDATSTQYYRLEECSDCSVANPDPLNPDTPTDPNGYLLEFHTTPDCSGDPQGSMVFPELPGCMWNQPMDVTECTGIVDPPPRELGGITSDCPCTTEVENCLCNAECTQISSHFFAQTCVGTAYELYAGLYSDDHGVCTSNSWYETVPDCDANHVTPLWTCLYDNNCLNVFTPECCDDFPCALDTTCVEAQTTISFDGNENIWEDIYQFCEDPAHDCTEFRAYMLCHMTCDWGDDGEDEEDDGCFNNVTSIAMFECLFDADCYVAFNATLGNIFSDEGPCEEEFCSPATIRGEKDTFCAANTCNTQFNELFTAFIDCFETECPFANCATQIADCEADTTCYDELVFVSHIEQNYHAAKDDDLMIIIKNKFCLEQDTGACTALLDTAFQCVEQYNCFTLNDDQCWEINCKDKVDECAANTNCINTLLEGIGNETDCRREINRGEYTGECPDCDELWRIKPFDGTTEMPVFETTQEWVMPSDGTCGVQPPRGDRDGGGGGDNGYYVEIEGAPVLLYDLCKEACDSCGDHFFDIGRRGCGNGECDGSFIGTMKCIVTACPDEEEEDGCHNACWEETIDCMWDGDCWDDWQWVDTYFSNIDWDNFGTTFAYTYATSGTDFSGCLVADIPNFTDMSGIMGCLYNEFVAYCDDTTENPNGCNRLFWKELSCLLGECHAFYGVDVPTTEEPPPTTTQAPDEATTTQAPEEATTTQAPEEPTTTGAPEATTTGGEEEPTTTPADTLPACVPADPVHQILKIATNDVDNKGQFIALCKLCQCGSDGGIAEVCEDFIDSGGLTSKADDLREACPDNADIAEGNCDDGAIVVIEAAKNDPSPGDSFCNCDILMCSFDVGQSGAYRYGVVVAFSVVIGVLGWN